LGLTAGPVPPRVDASVKAGLCDLVEEAVDAGWSTGRAAVFLGLDADRVTRWQGRRAVDRLADATPGGHPVHGLLAWERAAVLALFASWGEVDRSHRKLAHRGSRLDVVHVSESTVRRVLMAEGLVLPGHPPREPTPRSPWPPWLEWKPNRIWAYDFTHFTRARRAAIAILDMVSRKWLTTLVSAEESSVQVEVAFLAALDAEDLLALADARASAALRCALAAGNRDTVRAAVDDGQVPLLLAVSDNGPQMRSHTTREFMAASPSPSTSAARTPRPTRPGSRPCSGTSRASGRTWRRSPTRPSWRPSWIGCAPSTTPCGCTPGSAMSPPTMNTTAGVTASARPAAAGSPPPDWPGSPPTNRRGKPGEHRARR